MSALAELNLDEVASGVIIRPMITMNRAIGLSSLKARFTRKRRPYDWKREGFVA